MPYNENECVPTLKMAVGPKRLWNTDNCSVDSGRRATATLARAKGAMYVYVCMYAFVDSPTRD